MPTYEENVRLASKGKSAENQMIPDMATLLGRPLTIGEERTLWHKWEEHSSIEAETKRLLNEKQKILLEGEKIKQTAIAQAIASMSPRWERGGQQVDIGGFSQGGAPMKQVAVGPGSVGKEITPAGGTQYVQPGAEQQRMGQQLTRHAMGLPIEDPMDIFNRQMQKLEEQEAHRVRREDVKEAATRTRQEKREATITERAEAKEEAQLKKSMELKFEDIMTGVRKAYNTDRSKISSDPLKKDEEKASLLEDLKDAHNAAIDIVAKRAKRHGIELDSTEFHVDKDPSVLSAQQLRWYKTAPKALKKTFKEAYEKKFGKPLQVGEK